jgi:hypothetical protein
MKEKAKKAHTTPCERGYKKLEVWLILSQTLADLVHPYYYYMDY